MELYECKVGLHDLVKQRVQLLYLEVLSNAVRSGTSPADTAVVALATAQPRLAAEDTLGTPVCKMICREEFFRLGVA